MAVDLHIHTNASDGRFTAVEIVSEAILAGLQGIAITDHDTIAGYQEWLACKSAATTALTIIPGIEFSTDLAMAEVHILGYCLDYEEPELKYYLHKLQQARSERAEKIVAKINKLGYKIEMPTVIKIAASAAIGRPHIAKALVEQGYFPSVADVFCKLLQKNGPAYVPHYKLTPTEIIRLIHNAGGAAVLAHPGLIHDDVLVIELCAIGLDGLEVYYPEHTPAQTAKYEQLADAHGLLRTGGSDYHGIPGRLPEKLGVFTAADILLQKLQDKCDFSLGKILFKGQQTKERLI